MATSLRRAIDELSAGRIEAARAACAAILKDTPDHPAALHLLGIVEHQAGDLPAAREHLRRAAESPAATAAHLSSYAELCLKATDPAAAIELQQRAVALSPAFALGWLTLGKLQLEQRQYAAARSSFAQALQVNPDFWEAANGLAKALQDLGLYPEALAQAVGAAARWPDTTDLELRAADIEFDLGRHACALERLERLERRAPDDARVLALKAHVLRRVDRFDAACDLCRDASARGIETAELLRAHGLALQLTGREAEALGMFERSAALGSALAESDRGVLLGQLGRTDEARETFDRVLERQPALADAWYHKSNATRHAPADPALGAMQALLADDCAARDRLLLHFALGKAHMDTGDAPAAFAHWHAANRLKRAVTDYDPDAAARRMAHIARQPVSRAAAPADREPAASRDTRAARHSELPVFVVGMPRSGSTLVEQILASHPAVYGGGELLGLRALFEGAESRKAADATRGIAGNPTAWAADSGGADLATAALARLRRAARFAPGVQRIIDKDLANFLHLGTIHRVFPRARVIHCRRNPLDSCLSTYTKLFSGDLGYAYDLAELGRYYRDYHQLMTHWRSVLPGEVFMEVDYESLVADTQQQTQRLLGFLGLPWHDACTRFFETARTVRTASVTQVRRPIYRSSIDRAATLRPHLGPLIDALGPLAGERSPP